MLRHVGLGFDVDEDRLLVAGWLALHGHDTEATQLALTVIGDLPRVERALRELVDVTGKQEEAFDDAERYAWTEHALSHPPCGSWLDWSDQECERLREEGRDIAGRWVRWARGHRCGGRINPTSLAS